MAQFTLEERQQRLRLQLMLNAQAYREQLLQRLLTLPASDLSMIKSNAQS